MGEKEATRGIENTISCFKKARSEDEQEELPNEFEKNQSHLVMESDEIIKVGSSTTSGQAHEVETVRKDLEQKDNDQEGEIMSIGKWGRQSKGGTSDTPKEERSTVNEAIDGYREKMEKNKKLNNTKEEFDEIKEMLNQEFGKNKKGDYMQKLAANKARLHVQLTAALTKSSLAKRDKEKLRRGADRAEIYSLAFSANAQWLAVSSDKGTVHVFGLRAFTMSEDHMSQPSGDEIGTGNSSGKSNSDSSTILASNPGSSLSFMKGVLPSYFSSEWSFAQFHLPEETRAIVAFGPQKNTVLVAGIDGSFYKCSFDPLRGGEMVQQEFAKFLRPDEEESSLFMTLDKVEGSRGVLSGVFRKALYVCCVKFIQVPDILFKRLSLLQEQLAFPFPFQSCLQNCFSMLWFSLHPAQGTTILVLLMIECKIQNPSAHGFGCHSISSSHFHIHQSFCYITNVHHYLENTWLKSILDCIVNLVDHLINDSDSPGSAKLNMAHPLAASIPLPTTDIPKSAYCSFSLGLLDCEELAQAGFNPPWSQKIGSLKMKSLVKQVPSLWLENLFTEEEVVGPVFSHHWVDFVVMREVRKPIFQYENLCMDT
eukprot:Gb_19375 [translate_table: standard]